MPDEETQQELSRQARAAETKKRRTRERLIQAAAHVLREEGQSATVDAIAQEAGVSTATFYSFYPSRNALCVDAFTELVVYVFQNSYVPAIDASRRIDVLLRLVQGKEELLRAALIGRLERQGADPPADFVRLIAYVFWVIDNVLYTAGAIAEQNIKYEIMSDVTYAMALSILDTIARERTEPPSIERLRGMFNVVDQALAKSDVESRSEKEQAPVMLNLREGEIEKQRQSETG